MTASAEQFYSALGRRIRDARRGRGVTQQGLGDMLAPTLSRSAIANIETGEQGVLAYTLSQIALALAVPVEALVPPLVVSDNANGLEIELTTKLPRELGERLHERLSRLPEAGGANERTSRPTRGRTSR